MFQPSPSSPFASDEKRIGAHTYRITQLDGVRGYKAALRLMKVLGPASTAAKGGDDEAALGALLGNLNEADLTYLCDQFASVTEVSGGKYGERRPQLDAVFATHFAGNYGEMIGWLAFSVMFNFASFFDGARDLIGSMARAESESKPTSTGSSGA